MNANTSKQDADNANQSLDSQSLKRIRAAIAQAASKGLYEVMIFETISRDNITLLQTEGYRVSRRGGRMGENNYLVRWDIGDSPQPDTPTDTSYYPGGITPEHPPI